MGTSFWMDTQNGNYSNSGNDTFDPKNNYIGIRLQQGVPLLDRDWNELEDIRRYQDMRLRQIYIGDGTPDNGFAIAATNPTSGNFTVSAGSYLVKGFEAVNSLPTDLATLVAQNRANAITANGTYYVFLEVTVAEAANPPNNSVDVNEVTCMRHVVNWQLYVGTSNTPPASPSLSTHHYALLAVIQYSNNTVQSAADQRQRIIALNSVGTNLINLNLSGALSFGAQTRQMINLWGTDYGIGVQSWTQYFRTDRNFVWYTGGVHNDAELNPGGGTAQMTLSNGNLFVEGNVGIGTTTPGSALDVGGTNNSSFIQNLSSWGLNARTQGIIIMPEGDVTDDGAGNLKLPSTIIMNPLSGSWIRVNAGTYALGVWASLWAPIPPTSARGTSVNPTILAWADTDRNYDGRDRVLLAQRWGGGPIYTRFGLRANYSGNSGAYFTGNVGIGTTKPTGKLEINMVNSSGWSGNLEALRVYSPDNNYWLGLKTYVIAGGNVGYTFGPNGGFGALSISTPGYVGIGTLTPSSIFNVYNPNNGNINFFSGAGDLSFDGGTDGIFFFTNTSTLANAYTAFVANNQYSFITYNNGNAYIRGSLSKAQSNFLIDHPLDPKNKTLRHSTVESPEDLCLYRGKVSLDSAGKAIVKMPDYFAALTKEEEATVTLTPVGKKAFLTSYEWNKKSTEFTIHGQAGAEVTYIVLADRDDKEIRYLRRHVEEEKGNGHFTKGEHLIPEAHGEKPKNRVPAHQNKPAEKVEALPPPVAESTEIKASQASVPKVTKAEVKKKKPTSRTK